MALLGICPLGRMAWADAAGAPSFELQGGPLKEALARFDALTLRSVFFPSALVEGRSASAVQGRMAPDEALDRLLKGSGLIARAVGPDAFVLLPSEPENANVAVPPSVVPAAAPALASRAFDGLLQARLLRSLCDRGDLALGSYRLALRVQIDAGGRAAQVRLLDTTGNRARDAAIVDAALRVDLGQPPADPGRPFVLLLRPQPPDAGPVCAAPP